MGCRRTIAARVSAIVLTMSVALPAHAEDLVGVPLRVGLVGGYQLTSGDIDVAGSRTTADQASVDAAILGLRVGWRLVHELTLELGARFVPGGTVAGDDAFLFPATLDAVVRPFEGDIIPTLSVGGGVMISAGDTVGNDVDAIIHSALGIEFILGRAIALRVEAELFMTDGVDAAVSVTPAFSVGVDLLAWRQRRGPAAVPLVSEPLAPVEAARPGNEDPDGDGVLGASDLCPAHAGKADDGGCPDSDNDGLIDAYDACPTRGGSAAFGGCADQDSDGVPDRLDACPLSAGEKSRYGCP